MRHLFVAFIASAAVALLAVSAIGCNKPSEEDCKKALNNIRSLYETEKEQVGAPMANMVRACRGSASRESIQCFIEAKSKKDLLNCQGNVDVKMFSGDEADSAKQPEANEKDDKDK